MTDDTMRDQDRVRVVPDDAEFWDSPGAAVSYVKMAAAAISANRKVAL